MFYGVCFLLETKSLGVLRTVWLVIGTSQGREKASSAGTFWAPDKCLLNLFGRFARELP